MDLSKVRLVVSDMDGTLLNSKGQVSDTFITLFKELKEENIQFIAASGRQYYSIIDKLKEIHADIIVIAENGGFAKRNDEELVTVSLPLDKTREMINLMRQVEDAHIVLCGKKQAYVDSDNEKFLNIFNEYYHKYQIVDDITKIDNDEFFKIAVYSFGGSEQTTYPVVSHLENEVKVKVSGENWLDISSMKADKGNALKHIQEMLGIHPDETMVFGDYNNDIEMLELAHFSYAMANAHPNVTEAANYITKSNNDLGVEIVLNQLIEAKRQTKSQKQ
ncbi:HAD family hydrolase [Leeuwenhoekiella sp. A16]|uniref:HAD family hydrolase n=1 Tax=unclassified Leeuwenhoekiella TaxID=2615029 RepID=UPI003A80C157